MKKIINFSIKVIAFIIIVIIALNIFVKYKSYNILDALISLNKIETANIDFKFSKLYNKDGNEEQINLLYKFNFDNNFNDDIYKNVIATNGNIGIEAESIKMGIYAPIQTVLTSDNLDIYFSLDDVYSNLIGISGDENIHIDVNSVLSDINYKQAYKDGISIKNDFYKSIYDFSKKHKNDFVFLRNEKQTILSGSIGRLSTIITEAQIDDLYSIIEQNIDKKIIDSYQIDSIFNKVKQDLIGGNIYINIYKNNISSITIEAHTFNMNIDINNINNSVHIEIPKEENSINFRDYFNENLEDIFKIFGLNITVEKNNLNYFKDKFEDLAIYMTAAIDYSDKGNFEYASISLENIEKIIKDMESRNFEESDTSLTYLDYTKWVELFKELKNYAQLYKDSIEDATIDLNYELSISVKNISKLMEELNINLLDTIK